MHTVYTVPMQLPHEHAREGACGWLALCSAHRLYCMQLSDNLRSMESKLQHNSVQLESASTRLDSVEHQSQQVAQERSQQLQEMRNHQQDMHRSLSRSHGHQQDQPV